MISRLGSLRFRALRAGAREVEGRRGSGSLAGEEAKRWKAEWMERSVGAEMLFWSARGEGCSSLVDWGGGGGGREGRERVGGCGEGRASAEVGGKRKRGEDHVGGRIFDFWRQVWKESTLRSKCRIIIMTSLNRWCLFYLRIGWKGPRFQQ